MSARDDILAALRERRTEQRALPSAAARAAAIPARATAADVDVLGVFIDRATRRGSQVERVADLESVAVDVAALSESLGSRDVCSAMALEDVAWQAHGLSPRYGAPRSTEAVSVSVASCAIAETGTLVLLTGHNAHSATVLPQAHVVCVAESAVVATMEDALVRIGTPLPRAVVFLTGVSSTGDIGLQVVAPAQGPKTLRILVVADGLDLAQQA